MRKEEFVKELEYLLQDIPEEDKADAIAYYQDYLEDAGPDEEERVIREFGSPERIAAIIRADLNGNLEDGGEFTEKGYEDERFKEPNFQLAKRLDLPEEKEEARSEKTGGPSFGYGSPAAPKENRQDKAGKRKGRWEWWQIAGMIVLACLLFPAAVGIVGGAIGLVFGLGGGLAGILAFLAGVLLCVTVALAAATFGLLLAGIAAIIFGIIHLTVPVQGILYIGAGTGVLGLGFLGLALCGLYYGKFLPWLFASAARMASRLFRRRKANA